MKKITYKAILTGLAIIGSFTINAQEIDNTIGQKATNATGCGTVAYGANLKDGKSKEFKEQQFENWLAPHISDIKAKKAASKGVKIVYTIPVVVHVVHNGDAINTIDNVVGENISDAQVLSQIRVLNDDFRRIGARGGANSTGAAVDVEINFCLAQTDENGNSFNGINRISGTSASYSTAAFRTLQVANVWDQTKYLNLWSFRTNSATFNGLAYFPTLSGLPGLDPPVASTDPIGADGAIVTYDAFGSEDDDDGSFVTFKADHRYGRVMTHELGHWLGLRHVWGDTGVCNDAGDYCDDTPQSTFQNFTCAIVDRCPSDGLGNDMIENYMDVSPDDCQDTFTNDQKTRMLAVLTNSPRRVELITSVVCSAPAPYISFTNPTQTLNETTDCSFTDVVIDMTISDAPSANAFVTVSGTGTATAGVDYEIIGSPLTFPSGATGSQNFTLRIFNDGFIEADETLTLDMVVNANGGDALATATVAANNSITLVSDNIAPVAVADAVETTVFSHTSSVSVWDHINQNGNSTWQNFTSGVNIPGYIEPNLFACQAQVNSNDYIISPEFTIPTNANQLTLSHAVASYLQSQEYELWFATDTSNEAAILSGTLLDSGTAPDSAIGNFDVLNLDAFLTGIAGQTGSLVLRQNTTTANGGYLIWDTITLTASYSNGIQTVSNAGTAAVIPLENTGTIFATDTTSDNVMASINNTNSVDYGCVTTSVSRDTGASLMYQVAGTGNFVMGKTFTITPAIVQATGNAIVKFYFTEAEIAQWETETSNVRTDLVVIKDNGSTSEPSITSIGAFGTNVTLEVTFASGINGTYYFGKTASLTVTDNHFTLFNIYPNPSNGEVTLTLSTNEDVQISLFDIRGRNIYSKLHVNNSNVFNTTLNYSDLTSGIYMLNVESGSKRAIKKIIIK